MEMEPQPTQLQFSVQTTSCCDPAAVVGDVEELGVDRVYRTCSDGSGQYL